MFANPGTNWYDPTHDAAGNMTSLPKPSSPANGLTCAWHGWNRLTRVADGVYTVAVYESDGTNRPDVQRGGSLFPSAATVEDG